jgi:replicative DNA helicase
VDGSAIKKGRVSDDGWRHIARAAQRIEAANFLIDAQPGISLAEIRGRSRRLAAKHGGLAGIVVDYLQLMQGAGDERSREREVAKISRGLKMLAMEIDCPVYVLSQLNRSCEDRPDKRPQVSDLRESGAIEQDADCIWLLYRRGYYAAQMAKDENQAPMSKFKPRCTIEPGEDDGKGEVIVGKQRDGSPGVVRLRFEGPCTRYVDNDFVQPRGVDLYAHVGGSPNDGSGDGEPFQEDWYP